MIIIRLSWRMWSTLVMLSLLQQHPLVRLLGIYHTMVCIIQRNLAHKDSYLIAQLNSVSCPWTWPVLISLFRWWEYSVEPERKQWPSSVIFNKCSTSSLCLQNIALTWGFYGWIVWTLIASPKSIRWQFISSVLPLLWAALTFVSNTWHSNTSQNIQLQHD